jgi:hypothetical protein
MISDFIVIQIIGLLFIAFGIALPKYKLYWLIAGLNDLTKEELEKYDLRYIEKYFGRAFFLLGVALIAVVFLGVQLKLSQFIWPAFILLVVSTVIILVIFGASRKSKTRKS